MSNTTVLATATGIVCGKCSTFSTKIRHASVVAVRLCNYGPTVSVVTANDAANAEWAEAKNEAAAMEQAQEAAAYMAKATAPTKPVKVAAGRYAVEWAGKLGFFRVDVPTEGKWAGYTFVKQQASDTEYPVRNRTTREGILAEIAKDQRAAMLRYGRELGHCGHCGRTLTNEESRAAGIGPICSGKMGW